MTREQVATWLGGVPLGVAAPQLTEAQFEFVIRGALPDDDELLGVWDAMVGMRASAPLPPHGSGS